MNKRKGISLIVLVITILVMIILAGVVVVSLSKNNPIDRAKEAVGITNLSSLKEELEMYKLNKVSNGENPNISLNKEDTEKILKNIPSKLKNNVIISNGILGVNYKKLENIDVVQYAVSNDIFDLEDIDLPDADVYKIEKDGKTYIKIDAVDYGTDVYKIKFLNTNTEKIIGRGYEKVAYRRCRPEENDYLLPLLKSKIANLEEIKDFNDISKYNVVIACGGYYAADNIPNADIKYHEYLNTATKEKPKFLITSGNDTRTGYEHHIMFYTNTRPVTNPVTIKSKKIINEDNNITRQIDKWINSNPNNAMDHQTDIKFKDSTYLTRYYTAEPILGEGINEYINRDNIGMYLDTQKGKGWFHMQCGPWYNGNAKLDYVNAYRAIIYKMTGSRSMEVEVKTPGIYTFEIEDLAGNKITKSITI